jgi:hypothetical protein
MADQNAQVKPDEKAVKLQDKIESLRKSREKYEQKCYINDAFMDGEHFMGFNRSTGRLEKEKAPRGMANRIIHKGYRKMVEMKSTIVADDPKWLTHPQPSEDGSYSQDQLDEAMKVSDWLMDIFTRKKVDQTIDDGVFYATKHPYSVWWADYDPIEDEFTVNMHDFYDVLCDANIDDIQDSTVVVKQFVREKPEVLANPLYTIKDAKQITVDKRWAASTWKNNRMEDKYSIINDFREPVICSETWQRVVVSADSRKEILKANKENSWINENDQEGNYKIKDGQKVMYICTLAGGTIVRESYAPFHMYPCTAMHIPDGPLLQPAPVERIISANKSLDIQVSRQEQYVAEVAVGRVKKHKDVKVHRMTNEHGSYWEWEGPIELEPKVEPIPSLPATVMQVQSNTERYIDESSVYGSSITSVMHGGRGANLAEQLKGTDVQAMQSGRKHLATCLEQLAEALLMLADWNLDHPQAVAKGNDAKSYKDFTVIGARYAQTDMFQQAYGASKLKPTVIDAGTKVTVSIESGLAYTQQAKQDLLMNLASMGALSVQSLLTLMKVSGNVSEELRMIMQEQGKSMIYADDFKALNPETQMSIIEELQKLNISMPLQPKPIGTVKRTASSDGGGGMGYA